MFRFGGKVLFNDTKQMSFEFIRDSSMNCKELETFAFTREEREKQTAKMYDSLPLGHHDCEFTVNCGQCHRSNGYTTMRAGNTPKSHAQPLTSSHYYYYFLLVGVES